MDKTNSNGALGGGIGKLLLRNLPSNYSYNSIYGLFPFYTPKTMSSALQDLRLASQYALDRPMKTPDVISVDTWAGVTSVLADYKSFNTVYGDATRALTNGYGCVSNVFLSAAWNRGLFRFFLAWDEPAKHLADMDLVSLRS